MRALLFAAFVLLQAPAPSPAPVPIDDAGLVAAVARFYEMQAKEDVDGYYALWSSTAQKPPAAGLRYVFDSGDDVFRDVRILRTSWSGNRLRVQVSAERQRTLPPRVPGGSPYVGTNALRAALTYVREGGAWKLVREGSAADDLAAELADSPGEAERNALLAAEADLDGPLLAGSLARLGGVAVSANDYKRAEAVFRLHIATARRNALRKEEGEGLQNLANALYFQRRFGDALAVYEERLALERGRGDDAAVASALAGVATIRYSAAEYTEALARYREALAIHERLDDVAGIAFASLSIGNITYLQGDYETAIASFRRSLDLHRTMSDADGESRALEGLGLVFMAQGDYAGALASFETVRRDIRLAASRLRLGAVAQNAGDVHVKLGNLDAARASFEESRGHFEAKRDLASAGRVMQSLGLTEAMAGRYLPSQDWYTRSEATCTTVDDKECAAHAVAGLAYAQMAQDMFAESIASYRRAIERFTALGRSEDAARASIGLSEAQAGAGDFAAARDAAQQARRTAVTLDKDDVLWRALTAEARAARKGGQREAALGIARAATVTLDRMETAARDRPGGSLPAGASAAFATFALLQAESGDAAGAFATADRVRKIDMRASLAANEREIARGMTSAERDEERALAAQQLTALARLGREKALPKPEPARVEALQRAADDAASARRAWVERLFTRLPELRGWRGLDAAATAADAAPLVAETGSVLVAFVAEEDALLSLVLTKAAAPDQEGASQAGPAVVTEAFVAPVKRRRLADAVAALQQPEVLGDVGVWRKRAASLAEMIPEGALQRLAGASRATILPHDVLWRVPFDALPAGDGMQLDRGPIVLAGSVAAATRTPAAVAADGPTVALAAPPLDAARTERLKQVAPTWLLRSAESVRGELRALGTEQIRTFDPATEAAARDAIASSSVAHIAAPFRINAASPLFSSILLGMPDAASGEPTAGDDGSLDLREIVNLDLHARVVVLSDGAATSMRDGAAAAPVVQWGWLAAGVPSVLLARWNAPDDSRDALLASFHAALGRGLAAPEALRAAQLDVRARPDKAAPLHWAGWMMVGAR